MYEVLFYRNFRGFSGGHLKIWDYFNHVLHSPHHFPQIYFSRESRWDDTNPWLKLRHKTLKNWPSTQPDILFLAGLDWLALGGSQRQWSCPIINLIQGVKHGQRSDKRFTFLKHKAIRICVSEEVASAITESGQVNGPVFTIPNGIDIENLPTPLDNCQKDWDILIAALKQPEFGLQVERYLAKPDRRINVLAHYVPRPEFLSKINRAKVTVFLPHSTEGFYLPALEGMALGTLVICPDCIGNRSFCLQGDTCFRPEYRLKNILAAITSALELSPNQREKLLINAKKTVSQHNLTKERQAFLRILSNAPQVW